MSELGYSCELLDGDQLVFRFLLEKARKDRYISPLVGSITGDGEDGCGNDFPQPTFVNVPFIIHVSFGGVSRGRRDAGVGRNPRPKRIGTSIFRGGMLVPAMAGFERLVGAICVLSVSTSVVSCRGASAPVPVARNNGQPLTTSAVQLKVGDPAPEFSLPASDGKVYSLASYRGKEAVVFAWFVKAFTGP